MRPRETMGFSSNWWIGSAIAGLGPFLVSHNRTAAGRRCPDLSISWLRLRGRRQKTGRPHHVVDTGAEAEHQKHDQAPRRGPEHPVGKPAETAARNHASHEFRRHPERAPER